MLFSARQKVDALAAGVLEVERGKKNFSWWAAAGAVEKSGS